MFPANTHVDVVSRVLVLLSEHGGDFSGATDTLRLAAGRIHLPSCTSVVHEDAYLAEQGLAYNGPRLEYSELLTRMICPCIPRVRDLPRIVRNHIIGSYTAGRLSDLIVALDDLESVPAAVDYDSATAVLCAEAHRAAAVSALLRPHRNDASQIEMSLGQYGLSQPVLDEKVEQARKVLEPYINRLTQECRRESDGVSVYDFRSGNVATRVIYPNLNLDQSPSRLALYAYHFRAADNFVIVPWWVWDALVESGKDGFSGAVALQSTPFPYDDSVAEIFKVLAVESLITDNVYLQVEDLKRCVELAAAI